ncbi:MAG TPA: HEAT repeat domain-containing protein, partial [Candidatus Obscuribacterales bacterium]
VPTNSDTTCSWCPPGDEAKVVQEYKDEFARNLPDTWSGRASKEQITQLFDKLGHAVSAAGTPAEREALKKELAAKITFDRFQIEQLDQANQGALSDAQLHDLLDPDKRAALKNQQLKEIADEFATMKDSNVLAATSMALMILARTADQKGTISPAVADVDSYGHNAGYNDRGPSWVRPRTAHIQLDDALLTRNLQQTLPQMSADARGLAVGDLMVKTGTMKPQEFGSILQNVLTNPKSSAADKMNALSDAHGPRMAALVGGLIALQPPDAKGQAPGLATASGFGATVSDFMSTLSRVASTDSDRDVRTMAAGLMYGLKRFQKDAVMGSRLLDDLGELRQSDIDDKHGDFSNGDFSKHAQTLLNVEMSPIGPRAGTDRTLDAAESLSLLKTKLPAAEAAELQREIVRTLAGALKQSTPEQADRIAALITGDGMKQLSQTNPRLAEQTRTQFVSKLQLPPRYDATAESQLVSLVGKMVGIANGASDATKQQMFTALNNIAQNAPPVYMDLRSAAMEALGGLGSQSALPGLEKTAASDKFPALRLSALKALEQLKDPGLSELVSKRLGSSPEGGPRADASATESDATVLSYLRDLQYRLGGDRTTSVQYGDAASALMKFQTSINDRYTPLKSFNAAAQKDWTNEQFPLLVRANYDKEVVKQSDGKVSLWTGAPTDEGGDAVTAKRQEQFQQLAQVAQGNDQAAMQARKVLYSMITANGGTIGATEQIPTVIYVPNNGDSPYTQQAYYNEKPHDWATDAAVALAKTANAGFAGRDYTASLISQALASGVKGSAREQLLKAWETLGSTTGGVRTIPESLYQYVRSRAKE